MQKKEFYRCRLPHFQSPGQWYFVTCALEGAIPQKAMESYSLKLEEAKNRLEIEKMKTANSANPEAELHNRDLFLAHKMYSISLIRYRLAFDYQLNHSQCPQISLIRPENLRIMKEALDFWNGKRLLNHAWCVMPNHLHWVFSTMSKDESLKPVYLQDILHSVKLFTARKINENENVKGQLWMRESFETTIWNDQHFETAIRYTIRNPVKAGFVSNWREWTGSYLESGLDDILP